MLTFSKIGRKGNLGNQLFQIASTIGIASKVGEVYAFKEWQYQQFFKHPLPVLNKVESDLVHVNEEMFEYHDWNLDFEKDNDLEGWLQTEKYFNRDKTKFYFEFKENLVQSVKERYKTTFERETILISIRRGDFVNHPDYFQTPIQFYMNALYEYFPDWVNTKNLVILSDDINYCKFHFSFLENAFFGEALSAIEQLCLGSLCTHFIISNSTFSWWSAWLGEKENSKVIRPLKYFRGKKAEELDDKDYFPDRWLKFDFEEKRVPLKKVKLRVFKNNTILNDYLSYFFTMDNGSEGMIDTLELETDLPYLVSPVFYYYIDHLDVKKIRIKPSTVAFKMSNLFNYPEFVENKYDFGFFSAIFNFQNQSLLKSQLEDVQEVYVPVGLFVSFGGYSFNLKRYKHQKIITFKRIVKRILFRK